MTEEIKARIESIRKGEVPDAYSESVAGILPNDWTSKPLSEISEVISEQAGDDDYETLSISAGIGFVNQAQKFGKELSGKQYEKYTVLRKGDFAYNKGNSCVIHRDVFIVSKNVTKQLFRMFLSAFSLPKAALNTMSNFS